MIHWPVNSRIRRVEIPVVLNNRVYTWSEFQKWAQVKKVEVGHIMELLPALDATPNMELSPGGRYYNEGMRLNLWVSYSDGRLMVEPIPVGVDAPDLDLTKPTDLVRGKYSTVNILCDIPNLDKWKAGKRVKLFTGWKVRGAHPLPTTISSVDNAPDGVIYVSEAYARKFQLLTSYYSGTSTEGTHYNTMPLENGDKITGALPNGWAVKGSIVVRKQVDDMVVPVDSIKLKDVPMTHLTRFWVRDRAAERLSLHGTRFSYQAGQFMPAVVHRMIAIELRRPLPLLDNEAVGLSPHELLNGINTHIWTPELKDTMISLFQWIENGNVIDGYYATQMKDGLNPWSEGTSEVLIRRNRLRVAIQAKIRMLLGRMVNPQVRGIWGVLMPHPMTTNLLNDEYWKDVGIVSLPLRGWNAMGCPRMVAALRVPVKGHSSIVRLEVRTHTNGSDIRVHKDIVTYCWNGDHDGDLVEIIADYDIVKEAIDPHTAISMNMSARTSIDPITMSRDNDLSTVDAQVNISESRYAISGTTTLRDNIVACGATEEEVLRIFEVLLQPGIAEKDGGGPVGTYLMANLSELAQRAGIRESLLDDNIIYPTSQLRTLRGREDVPYMYRLKEFLQVCRVAMDDMEDSANSHSVILSAFSTLPDIEW